MSFVPLLPTAEGDAPRVRLGDYYATVAQEQDTTERDTEAEDGSDDAEMDTHEAPDLPRVRLDETNYYATLQAQQGYGEGTEDDTGAQDELDEAEMNRALPVMKRKKHKAMSAEQQIKALEALQAQREKFQEPPTPISPPAEVHEAPIKAGRKRKSAQEGGDEESETRPKHRRASQHGEKPKTLSYRAAKTLENNIKPEIQDIILRMQRLGKLEDDVESVISAAGMVLDGQEKVDGIMAQLFQMGDEWKAAQSEHRGKMVAFLERYGVIPMGSAS